MPSQRRLHRDRAPLDFVAKDQAARPASHDDRGIIACLIVLQIAIFAAFFAFKGFGLDEIMSLVYTDGSIRDIYEGLRRDAHPPGYLLLLWGWEHLVPISEYSIHLFSLLLSLPTIPLLYVLVRRLVNRTAALWACLFMTLSAFNAEFSAQARMYSVFEMLTVLSTLLLVVADEDPKSKRAAWGYALAMAANFWMHYFTIFVIASHVLYLLLRGRLSQWRRWLPVFAAIAVLSLPGLVLLPGQMSAATYDWIERTQPAGARAHFILDTFNYFVFGDWHPLERPVHTLSMMYMTIPCLAAGIAAALGRRSGERRFPAAGILPLMLIAPIYLVFTASQRSSIFMPRYMIMTVPFFFALFGIAVSLIPNRMARRACGLLVAAHLAACLVLAAPGVPRVDWKNAIRAIQEAVPPERLADFKVFSHDAIDFKCVQYYMLHGKPEFAKVQLVMLPFGDYSRMKPEDMPKYLCAITRQRLDGAALPPGYTLVQVRPFNGCYVTFFSRER